MARKSTPPMILRQGDVLLQPIKELSPEFQAAPHDADGSATLALGESTNHRHRFERAAAADGSALSRIFVHPTARAEVARLVLDVPAALVHEEHSTHHVPAGTWRISRPYEYEGTELPRMVAD